MSFIRYNDVNHARRCTLVHHVCYCNRHA